MKCSGSPITSTVPDARAAQPRAMLAALVFADVLKPLTAALGPLGETVAATVAERAFLGRPR